MKSLTCPGLTFCTVFMMGDDLLKCTSNVIDSILDVEDLGLPFDSHYIQSMHLALSV